MPEKRPLFERIIERHKAMESSLLAIREQHNSYLKYRSAIRMENQLTIAKCKQKETRLKIIFERESNG